MPEERIIDLDDYIRQDAFVRKLAHALDTDWLIERLQPYYPDVQDITAPPVRMVCLVMLEHLQPFALRMAGKQFIECVYQNWSTDFGYMWLLQATTQSGIPSFSEVFYDPCDKLPPELLREIFAHILTRCVSGRVAGEYRDEALYGLQTLSRAEQEAEIDRLAQAYMEQLFQEVAEVRKRDISSKCVSN